MATSTLILSDCRTLAYLDYEIQTSSSSDASPRARNGPTIFYFHGFPGSRLEGDLLAPTAKRHGARLISIDRPGMGLSTFQPDRTLLDWPRDVLELADHLQIPAFYVVGASGGAPYVFACVKALPRNRLLGASVVAGIYPLSLGTQGMSMDNRILLWTASSKWLGGLTGRMMDWAFGAVARDHEHPERLTDLLVKGMRTKPEPDAKCFENEWARDRIVEAARESFRQDGDCVALDIKLIARDWGFNLEDLNIEGFRICLWHGKRDANVPVSMAEKAAALMKGVDLRVLEDEAHLSMSLNHQDEILKALLVEG